MSEQASTITDVLVRELERLRDQVREVCAPLTEQQFWAKPIEPGNSVGHLALHLAGNLNYFVGAQLGGTGYVRDREREFMETDRPSKAATLQRVDEAIAMVRRVVGNLTAEQLQAPHPEKRFGTVLQALVHLTTHFALHRGQMSYIIRLVNTPTARTL